MIAIVGIKSCRTAKECVSFMQAHMDVTNYLQLCFHEQTQAVADAA